MGLKGKKVNGVMLGCIGFVVLIFIGIFAASVDNESSKQYYVRDMKVCEAAVVESQIEDGKYYLRVLPSGDAAVLNAVAGDLWIEVTEAFYSSAQSHGTVGVLLSDVDVYKLKYFGLLGKKGQTYEREIWNVEEIYPSLAEAKAANPVKQYQADGVVKKKKILKNGDHYIVIQAEGRTFSTKVTGEFYEFCTLGQSVKAELESIGDVVKLNKVVTAD